MNHEAARALANHLSGLYRRTVVKEVHWVQVGSGRSGVAFQVRALHPAGFWVVYTRPC